MMGETTTTEERGPRVIGLLGGIGAGKSSVAQRLAENGAVIISGDQAGHEVLRQPEVIAELMAIFGTDILDATGNIDRAKLAQVVFQDTSALRKLEAVVHPRIGQVLRRRVTVAQRDSRAPLVVLDAALMLEAGWNDLCDELVFVASSLPLRLRRLQESRRWTQDDLQRREAAQLSVEEKQRRSGVVIDNTGTLADLQQKVDHWFAVWARPSAR